jgi:glycosyltransferase involved in cell wall biosynthesis
MECLLLKVEGLVSTIIPVYNRSGLLQEAVASVLNQDYRPIEILIVDDGSNDDTYQVVEQLVDRNTDEIRSLHINNSGPGAAREVGRLEARGEFVQYLDSDDQLLPEKFSAQVASLRAHSECGVSYGKTGYGQKASVPWKRTGERIETMWPSFMQARWWGTSTPLYRQDVTDAAGPWEALRHEEDWVYDCRVAILGTRLCYVDKFVSLEREVALNRMSANSSSPQYWRDRAAAHRMIWECAESSGPDFAQPELRHFARELFLLARQCGAAGMVVEARELFGLARAASGPERGRGMDFRLYRLFVALVGWTRMGQFACWMDRWRQ